MPEKTLSFPPEISLLALETAGIGAAVLDQDGNIAEANMAFAAILRQEPARLQTWRIAEFTSDPELPLPGGNIDRQEMTFRRGDSSPMRALVSMRDIDYRGKRAWLMTLRDISARKHAEDSVRTLDQRLRLLIESAQDAVITIDDASRIIDWNTAAERMFGWSRDDALGKVLTDLIVPSQHRGSHHEGLRRFLAGGEHGILNRRVETTGVTRDGREFDIELAVWPVESGGVFTFSSFIRDISSRKHAEKALRLSEEKYRAVVENANEGIIVTQDGYIRYGNPRAFALTGREPDVVAATPFIELIHPDDRARVYGNYLRRLRGEQVENLYNFRVVTSAGEIRWLQISAVAIDWQGKPATLNFLSDVTEQTLLQDSLRQSLTERETILEASPAGIMFVQNRQIRWLNRSLEQTMLGLGKGDLIGRSAESMFADHAGWLRFVDGMLPVLIADQACDGEWQIRRGDGSLIWCHVSGRALKHGDLTAGTIWILIDIAERKRAEEESRRALQRERELAELKTRFVAMASHEFRTPLATILSSTELIEDFGNGMPEAERRDLIGLIKSSLSRITGMLDQVLLIGQANSDRLEFRPAMIDANALCARLLTEMQRTISHPLHFHVADGDHVAMLDEKLMRHILTNLVVNAAKYSPDRCAIAVTLSRSDAGIAIEVRDQGIGIPEEDQARLFESFFRARNVGNIDGTGLGLAIVKQCVELHKGSISFESARDRGSVFRVSLPG